MVARMPLCIWVTVAFLGISVGGCSGRARARTFLRYAHAPLRPEATPANSLLTQNTKTKTINLQVDLPSASFLDDAYKTQGSHQGFHHQGSHQGSHRG